MPDYSLLPGWLHPALGLGWLLLAAMMATQPTISRAPARLQAALAALLSALLLPWLKASGHWPDAADKAVILVALLSLAMAAMPRHIPGRLSACMLGGFWIALGAAALRHGVPLPPHVALKAILLGLAILLLPTEGGPRWRQACVAAALLIAAILGVYPNGPLS